MSDIGILGDGQLGCLLGVAAQKMGHEVKLLSQNEERLKAWGLKAEEKLEALESKSDFLIIESEFFDFTKVESSKLFPRPEALRVLSDKLSQKNFFQELKLPSASFFELDTDASLESQASRFPEAFVMKSAFGGYDGKGVFLGKSISQKGAEDFVSEAKRRTTRIYVEEKIEFEIELALVSLRSDRDFMSYPLVVSEQKNGICDFVKGPAQSFGVDASLEREACDMAREIAEALDLRGAFAVEFFLCPSRGLLINELAPRVHNSGHFSLLQPSASQFSNHIRACVGDELVPYTRGEIFAMKNWIGQKELQVSMSDHNWPSGLQVCDYEKKKSRPGRKMGHFCYTAKSVRELESMRQKLEKEIEQYWERLT